MADDNRPWKYARYAIGEIVLVVIGILIALQINTWREEQKQDLEEIEILQSIKLDFINVIKECEENNSFRRRIIDAIRQLYRIIPNKDHGFSDMQLDSIIATLFIDPTYNNKTGSLDILFTSGKINLMREPDIKEALILWPQKIEDNVEDEIYSSENLRDQFYPLVRKYISIQNANKQISYKNLQLTDPSIPSAFKSDYEGLFGNIEFEGVLASRELNLSVTLIQTDNLIKDAQRIIEMIDTKTRQQH